MDECSICVEDGKSFVSEDVEAMKIHIFTSHHLSYVCLNCQKPSLKRITNENGITKHYQSAHKLEYARNKKMIDSKITNMGKLIKKALKAEKDAEAARLKALKMLRNKSEDDISMGF